LVLGWIRVNLFAKHCQSRSIHDGLREAAFKERLRIHDIVLEGIGLALKGRESHWNLPARTLRKEKVVDDMRPEIQFEAEHQIRAIRRWQWQAKNVS
jgi:hypothetical protein